MKREEKIAEKFLQDSRGATPTYEPLGEGLPPDFCIGPSAFEVRRLNQLFRRDGGRVEELEKVGIPLVKTLCKEFGKIELADTRGSYFWFINYSRPLQATIRRIATEMGQSVARIYDTEPKQRHILEAYGVRVELMPAPQPLGEALVLGIESDDDSGGWVREIYKESIGYAVKEKVEKTKAIADCFSNWTLILIDTIMMGPPERISIDEELAHFRSVTLIDLRSKLLSEIQQSV